MSTNLFRRPDKTMVYVYRRAEQGQIEYLLLKRAQAQVGQIWQTVVGAAEWDEELVETARREVYEETGLTNMLGIMAVGYAFSFTFRFSEGQPSRYAPGVDTIRNIVFAAQVRGRQPITLSDEHVEYGWFSYEEALQKLYWPEDKEALVRLHPMVSDT